MAIVANIWPTGNIRCTVNIGSLSLISPRSGIWHCLELHQDGSAGGGKV